jgi:heat shock protein 90kDa beta
LVSNANDALEKLRLTSLTNKQALDPEQPLNITIKAVKDEEGSGGRIIITGMRFAAFLTSLRPYTPSADYGIGMTPEELTTNLGTLAKSGTSEFLAKAESSDGTGQGNLIGAFGTHLVNPSMSDLALELLCFQVWVSTVASS